MTPTTPRADCPNLARKPRRDTLTLFAAASANRPIFSNMIDLLCERVKGKTTHAMPASAVAVFITWVPGIRRLDDRRHPAPPERAVPHDQHLSQLDALC